MGAYNDEFLFIHMPKCAGTSIREWLKRYVPGTIDFRDPECDLPIGHIPLKDIERWTGRSPVTFKKIVGIVRDPYTHQLSQWLFWRDRRALRGVHPHDRVAGMHPTLPDWLCDARCDFHVWYETQMGSSDPNVCLKRAAAMVNRSPLHGGYYKYWLTIDGEVPDNLTVIRMEDLDQVWQSELAAFTPGECPPLPVTNPGPTPRPARERALEHYTPLALEIVNDKFNWTFQQRWYEMLEAKQLSPFMGLGA